MAVFRIPIDNVGDFRTHAHLRQIKPVLIAETRLQSLLTLLGYIGRETVLDMRRTDDNLRARWKRAVHAAGQNQHANDIALDECSIDPGIQRLATALEREAFGFCRLRTSRNNRRARAHVEPMVANDLAQGRCNIEIAVAPDVQNDGDFALPEAPEERKQPLERIPLDNPFGGDPFGAIRSTGSLLAVSRIENHGSGQRTDAADRRPRLGLGTRGRSEQSRDDDERACPTRSRHRYTGKLSCLRPGISTVFPRSIASARAMRGRVACGMMTSSI